MEHVADPSLELARSLRAADRRRSERLREVLAGYDSATTVESRWESAAAFMLALTETDREYEADKRRAVHQYEQRRQAEAA